MGRSEATMDALGRDPRLRAFKATDSFAIEAYKISRTVAGSSHAGLVSEIRRTALRSGGALVAASARRPGGVEERRLFERARSDLIEGRYYLSLARRMGLIDLKRYRGLSQSRP